jgi:hypothetical protein
MTRLTPAAPNTLPSARDASLSGAAYRPLALYGEASSRVIPPCRVQCVEVAVDDWPPVGGLGDDDGRAGEAPRGVLDTSDDGATMRCRLVVAFGFGRERVLLVLLP